MENEIGADSMDDSSLQFVDQHQHISITGAKLPHWHQNNKINLSPSDWQTLFHKKNSQNSLPSKSNGLLLIRNHGIRRQRMNTIIPYGGR